jgi:protein SCO1/2
MNNKSILSVCLTILVPVFCYLILKHYSDNGVTVPRKLLLDEVIEKEQNGKTIYDTLWHKTGNIKLVNQLGDSVSLHDIKNKTIVIDLFFTHCASICPRLTRSMLKLQESFKTGGESRLKVDTSVVQFISLSIDPESDSVQQLKIYADNFGINPDNWWLLTGNRDSIYKFIFEELKIDKLSNEPVDINFAHTSRFALLDKNYISRGRLGQAYDGLDSISMGVLARDIGLLMLEKDKKKKSDLFTAIIDLSWLWLIIAICIGGFMWILKKNRGNGI